VRVSRNGNERRGLAFAHYMEPQAVHSETLEEQADHVIAEARMVLPGVQTLLGFQLVAVFNQRFTIFTQHEQALHFAAFLLIAGAMGFLMTPAAYHRQSGAARISSHFVTLATRLIMMAMWPLSIGVALDTYLIGRLIFPAREMAILGGTAVFLLLVGLWFVFPLLGHSRRGSP
jgi:Family of unknown function (DUF6328)